MELVLNFRRALIALIPHVECLGIPWRDDEKYDEWESLASALARLLREVIVEAHLSTTLRKMAQGQKCSLRFYPDGTRLRATGTDVAAGYSGDRLGNVLGMWADLGALDRLPGDRFAPTARGHELFAELAR